MTGGMGDGIVLTTLEIVDFRHADVTEMDIPEVNGCFDTVYKGKIWDSHEPYFNFVFFFRPSHGFAFWITKDLGKPCNLDEYQQGRDTAYDLVKSREPW